MSKWMAKGSRARERALDVIKELLLWAVFTALAFIYWMAVFLIFSLVLMNVWHTSFEAILRYSAVLTAVTSAVWLARRVRRNFR